MIDQAFSVILGSVDHLDKNAKERGIQVMNDDFGTS